MKEYETPSNEQNLLRPHFVFYDEVTNCFFVVLSWGDVVLVFEDQNNRLTYLNKMNTDGVYIKFINWVDEGLIIVAGNKLIIFEYDKNEFSVQERKEIPESWIDLVNYMTEIDGDWLLTEIVSNSGIVCLGG